MAGRAATSALLKLMGLWVFPLPFSPVRPEVRATALQKAKSIKKAEVYGLCINACVSHRTEWMLCFSVEHLGQVRRLLAACV